jgi:hypothetical protein
MIFNAAMVQALLAGRKTQHRVVLKNQPEFYAPGYKIASLGGGIFSYRWLTKKHGPTIYANDRHTTASISPAPSETGFGCGSRGLSMLLVFGRYRKPGKTGVLAGPCTLPTKALTAHGGRQRPCPAKCPA